LRVKNFYKRLPKTIAIYEPISKITHIDWISDDAFYFSAQEGKAYNVFSSNTLGEVQRCTSSQEYDYMYPNKIDSSVYWIQKDKTTNISRIVKNKWMLYDYESKSCIPDIQEILLSTSQPISYLHMISACEGFYLDYSLINGCQPQDLLPFICCRIYKDHDENWLSERLFEFKIPSSYVIGKEKSRLYESISPLLPKYSNEGFVYYVDATDEGFVGLKKYTIHDQAIQDLQLDNKDGCYYCKYIAPLVVGEKFYSGYVFDESAIHYRTIEFDGSIVFDLPEMSL